MQVSTLSKNNDAQKEELEYLKASVDPRFLLESLGFSIHHESYKWIQGPCRIHGGDNKTGFSFNKDKKTWVCFTKGCQEQYGYDIIGLIKATLGYGFTDSVNYLRQLVGDISSIDHKYSAYKRKRANEAFIEEYGAGHKIPAFVCDECLAKFKYFRSDKFLKDGFKPETLDYFEVAGGHVGVDGVTRDIIPIRSENGELLAYSLRDVRGFLDKDVSKYILTPGFNKDNTLYNLNNAQKYCVDKPLILVEGFKSVWRLYEYGIYNVVAVMGATVTEGQRNLLSTYAFNGVVIMFDNDLAGVKGTIRAELDLKKHIKSIHTVFVTEEDDTGKGLDPADLSKEVICSYLKTYY
jgi:hypothetical protein